MLAATWREAFKVAVVTSLNDQRSKREIAFYEKVIKVKADVAALLTFLVLVAFPTFPQKLLG